MRIISEKTGKEYTSVEECVKAEKAYDEKIAAEKAAKEKALVEQKAKKEALAAERKNAAECVEAKRKALVEAQKTYREELSNFCKKFGAYHYSVQPGEGVFDFWSSIFDNFWL